MTTRRQRARTRPRIKAEHERALSLVPASGRVEDLVESVSLASGRPVELLPFSLDRDEPTGMWIATESSDYIVFAASATATERTTVICHELAHILLNHAPVGEAARLTRLAASVAPDISPAVAERILARHGYLEEVEIEAETLATRLVAQLAVCAERTRLAADTISSRLR